MNSNCYRWRRLTDSQRQDVLAYRQANRLPWHSPPHYEGESRRYLITAACYEHAPVIGASIERMADFERRLSETLQKQCEEVYAWIVLPNHYHALVHAPAYAHPRFVWFLDELPLASTNKIDRDALRRLAQERIGGIRG